GCAGATRFSVPVAVPLVYCHQMSSYVSFRAPILKIATQSSSGRPAGATQLTLRAVPAVTACELTDNVTTWYVNAAVTRSPLGLVRTMGAAPGWCAGMCRKMNVPAAGTGAERGTDTPST